MDREIPDSRQLSSRAATVMLAAVFCLAFLANQTPAQERGFGRRGGGGFQPPTPEETFSRTDTDGDGTLSPAEINNSFMSRFLRDVDTSNGLSREQFLEEMQKMRERFGRGGRDRGDSDRRRDRGDDGGRGERSGDAPSDGSAQPQASGSTTPAPATGTPTSGTSTTRPRVTIDLQADLLPGDTDRDGQLGLYEWRRFAGRSLREFQQLDLNADGFVTPREYATVRPPPPPVAAPAETNATAAEQTAAAGTSAATPAPTGSPAPNSAAPVATMPADGPATRDAVRFFGLLDTNGDGTIAPSEWVDGRIRDLFTKNGVDLTQPLKVADFATHYVRLSASP